ncbi:MAG: hypothetical protein DI570_23890 [Phenylobacterium zucineum]|nr:MAG: hypothetical protein DI570_23890 [Phenylobacterium zucineum]
MLSVLFHSALFRSAVAAHVIGGGVGIVSGFATLATRKGGTAHRRIGTVFFVAMLVMAGVAAVLATMGLQRVNALAGLFTLYLIGTAWAVVREPPLRLSPFERWAPLGALAVALIALGFGLQAASPAGLQDGDPTSGNAPDIYFAIAVLAGLSVALDLKVIRQGGVVGASRIARHLWRMCLALFVAAGSFFFGQADEIPQALHGPHLALPPLAALLALVFWLAKVRWDGRRRARMVL